MSVRDSVGSKSGLMRSTRVARALLLLAGIEILTRFPLYAQTPPPVLNGVTVTNTHKSATWTPYPAVQQYQVLSATNAAGPFAPDNSGAISGYTWNATNGNGRQFFKLMVTPISSNNLWALNLINRLEYGPTPDELQRVVTGGSPIGPAALLNEQLSPWNITEDTSYNTNIAFVQAKLPEVTNIVGPQFSTNVSGGVTNIITNTVWANLQDLRAWHVLRGVGAKRQLLEILLQFWENHFVTQWTKTQNYFDGLVDGTTAGWVSTALEYRENENWRNAMLNPQCTFYDLLRVSAESPAMIIYLDTVLSRGNGSSVANENYARELMELFTMGVNNGYDQTDVTVMSRCWAGWYVNKVDPTNAFNPFAAAVSGAVSTNIGVWVLNYQSNFHNNNAKTNWAGKTVPARFGSPWAGRPYQLLVPARSGTNGMTDGYDVLTNIANLPFTEEFISCKLCNLFVHDGFTIGYNFTDPNLSADGKLVLSCMQTWENSTPKGQIWLVLSNIFNSDEFKGNISSMQKVKTPLEYTISAIRALRTSTNNSGSPGTFSADTDGYSISGNSSSTAVACPLNRMGAMLLFDREFPNGYPEDANGWISAGTLAERVRWMQTYLMHTSDSSNKGDSISGGNKSVSDPVMLLTSRLTQVIPGGSLTSATNVADFFISILFPAEGKANLDLYRTAAINYLNDGSADYTPSSTPFSGLAVSNVYKSAYDTRVRGMVAMLMGFQRFEEQ